MTPKMGSQPRVTSTFTIDKVPTTPTLFDGLVRRPDGTETAIVPTVIGVGILRMVLPVIDQCGNWYWRIRGTAGVIAVDHGYFTVEPSVFETP